MNISIPYPEIQDIIKKKKGIELNMIVVQLVGMVNRLIGKDILSKEGNDILKVSLDQFPEVINALQRFDVQSIDFNSTSLDVCLFLK